MLSGVSGVPLEFVLFGGTLLAVAVFHRYALVAALVGLAAIIAWKFAVTGFPGGPGLAGFASHLGHEWVILANLLALLVSFAVLALPADQRSAIALRIWGELDYQEIAEIEGVPVGTIRSRLARARDALHVALNKELADAG